MLAAVGSPKAVSLIVCTAAMSSGCSGRMVIKFSLMPNFCLYGFQLNPLPGFTSSSRSFPLSLSNCCWKPIG